MISQGRAKKLNRAYHRYCIGIKAKRQTPMPVADWLEMAARERRHSCHKAALAYLRSVGEADEKAKKAQAEAKANRAKW